MWKFHLVLSVYAALLSVAVRGRGTPANINVLFLKRCKEYQQVKRPDLFVKDLKDCNKLLRLFNEAYIYKDPCNVTVESFDPFVLAAKRSINTRDKTLYWSGDVKSLVDEYSAKGRFTTIRDILAGYIIKDFDQWCGKLEYPGINTVSCPAWDRERCPLQAENSCWKALSRSFAREVQGDVTLMLNGSNGRAYNPTSVFALDELPNLESRRNPVLRVQLFHNINKPEYIRETCKNGTLLHLKADVERKKIVFKCTDDPVDVL